MLQLKIVRSALSELLDGLEGGAAECHLRILDVPNPFSQLNISMKKTLGCCLARQSDFSDGQLKDFQRASSSHQ